MAVLNRVLRPVLSHWHPMLKDYEDQRPEGVSATTHERNWEHAGTLRAKIATVQEQLTEYADVLAEVSGVRKMH